MPDQEHLLALPEYFTTLLEHSEDISQQVLVAWPEQIEGELVNRIPGWPQVKTSKTTKAAERNKKKDCPLCAFALSNPKEHGKIWEAYAGEEKNLDGVVSQAQDMGVPGINPSLAKKHFQSHNYDQPAPFSRLSAEERIKIIENIPDRKGRIPVILVALYRHRFLSRKQLVQLLIPGTQISQSDDKTISRLLSKLRFNHAVYEFYRDREGQKKYYALGGYGVPFVEQIESRLIGKVGVTKREHVSDMKMAHDIKASDVYILMRCQLYDLKNQIQLGQQPVAVDMPPESWWAERNLSMAFQVPGGEQKVEPDGFATLAINDGRHLQAQLPMWLEWDSGHKRERTIQQIVNYLGFMNSPAPGKRFPQTNVPGYRIPLLMVTSTPERAADLCGLVRKQALEQNMDIDGAPLMLITDQKTMETGSWLPGAWRDIRSGEIRQENLAELLLEASRPLLDAKPIHIRESIQIDHDGAKPINNLNA